MISFLLIIYALSVEAKPFNGNASYLEKRRQILAAEDEVRVGGDIILTFAEQKVNDILMQLKHDEIEASIYNNTPYLPHMHFFKAKQLMQKSKVFQIIRAMPKGGALHLHDSSMTDLTWLVKNVTYMPKCYMCFDNNNILKFKFSSTTPPTTDCTWRTVSSYREASGNVTAFDEMLVRNMSLVVDDPDIAYPTVNAAWRRFTELFQTINGLFQYAPAFTAYYSEALKEFYEDNVQYIEVRALLPPVYELDGSTHNKTWVMQTYKKSTLQFIHDHPDFSGAKIIASDIRSKTKVDILSSVKDAMSLVQDFPDFMAGYDLVGQEDTGNTLLFYLDQLLYSSTQSGNNSLSYFFHAGETDWGSSDVGKNVIDAILLNTTRIGHGYAIPKHPAAMDLIKKKNISVEVNPISNQVLKLVDDLQNHPASVLLSGGYPVVISADDPALWGARGLSYDFYEVFMGIGGDVADLKTLKQLAMNSIMYSAMNEQEKKKAMNLWRQKWDRFITEIFLSGGRPNHA
ncbi:hypothetical protein ScPMuIL_016154 [Solemya velum]